MEKERNSHQHLYWFISIIFPSAVRTASTPGSFSGALIEEEYPSGRKIKNEFESDGDLLNVTSKKSGGTVFVPYASNFSYTASGGISQMRLGNGRWETAKFNTRLQVTETWARTHAQRMRPATPHFTAENRLAIPTPTIDPVIVCVVDTGMPVEVAQNNVAAPAVSAQNPPTG